jgi:hypothetical protein
VALGFVYALVSIVAVGFTALAFYLAVRSTRIHLKIKLLFFGAELDADKTPPLDESSHHTEALFPRDSSSRT